MTFIETLQKTKPMKISQALLLALVFMGLFLFPASSFPDKPQDLSWEEQHKDESFLYLLIKKSVDVRRDCTGIERIHYIVKVQKDDAKDLGEIPLDYDRGFQEVRDIRAYVITPDGRKMKYKSIQDFQPYSGEPFYSDNAVKVVTMPSVVPGSIIDWQATIINKKPRMKAAFWEYFYFSSDVPVKSVKFELSLPKGMQVNVMNRNIDIKPVIEESGSKVTYRWERKFLDKSEPEEYMPPGDEIDQYVIVSNIKDWNDIAGWYAGLIDKNLIVSAQMKAVVAGLVKGKDKASDRIQAIIEYIQDNFRYVSMSFGYNNFEPHPSDEVFNNKYGDCKDQVLVAMSMLKEAGIRSYPALFCDEDSGDPSGKLPAPAYFNHAILGIEYENRIYYTDILVKGNRFNEACSSLQGGYVFLVKPSLSADGRNYLFSQLPVLSQAQNSTFTDSKVVIRPDGSALVEVSSLWSKDFSIEMRERWKSMTDRQRQEFMEGLDETYTAGGKMVERIWENIDSRYDRIQSFVKYEKPSWAEVSGDFLSFGAGRYGRENEFAVKTREHPIMFWSNSLHQQKSTYIIPKGFQILNKPKDIGFSTEFVDFSRTYKVEGQVIAETETTVYKRVRLPASDYEKIKEFYNKVSQLTNEKIIIRKNR